MGYRVTAIGLIALDPKAAEERVRACIDRLNEIPDVEDVNHLPGGHVVTFERDANWIYWDDDVKDALTELTEAFPIISAEIDYTGDDGEAWRHIFRDGQWLEQNGQIVYEEPGAPFPSVDAQGEL